jgi:hypothetical protein
MGDMLNRYVALLLALVFAVFASPAQAFLDPPFITPSAPFAGDLVSVNIRYGVCDLVFGVAERTQNGNSIHVVLSGVHYDDVFMCNFGDGGTGVFPVGSYPPGSYTLQIDFFYYSTTGIPETIPLGVVPFTVTAAPVAPMSAPVNDYVALGLLMLFLLGLGAWRLRARRSSWLLIMIMGVPFKHLPLRWWLFNAPMFQQQRLQEWVRYSLAIRR